MRYQHPKLQSPLKRSHQKSRSGDRKVREQALEVYWKVGIKLPKLTGKKKSFGFKHTLKPLD